MKESKFLFALLFTLVCFRLSAQTTPPKNYVVIGVFAVHENAIKLTEQANKLNFSAQYAINPTRQWYYVYILETEDRKRAFASVLKLRMETQFKDAWVYSGLLGEEHTNPEVPITVEPIPEVKPEPVVEVPKIDPPVETPVVVETPPVVIPEKVPEGKPFFFKLVSAETGAPVMGEVHITETPKAAQYQAFKGNDIVYLKTPRNTTANYIVSVSAPGYKPAKLTVNYKEPSGEEVSIGSKQEAIITMPLIRSRKGDYIEFNNVFFIRNSSIFQPQSQDELDGLAQLMKDQPKYKIRIHGHSNGKEDRDVVSMGTSTNYFATDPGNKKEKTTTKKLSELRAETLKSYLISQGVAAKLISTYGEGSMMMIYSPTSTLSTFNDRVEIEVIKGK